VNFKPSNGLNPWLRSMKLLTVVGARPQFIKAAMMSRALMRFGVTETILHTGQHYDFKMSELFFDELSLACPKYNLGVGSGSHGKQTSRMLEGIEAVLLDLRPDMVMTYGDTNSTLAGTLAAAKLHIPVSHVEAGLRSFNRQMPEEINRVLADHMADLLFAPTLTAVQNLQREGIAQERIIRSGDVMYDAMLHFASRAEAASSVLDHLQLQRGGYILATLHRCENTDNPRRLRAILGGLAEIAQHIPVVLPLHPRTRKEISLAQISREVLDRLALLEPLGYLDMIMLEKHACLIATDSGGIQKEAYFNGVPCVTLRAETEWLETLEGGCNQLLFPASQEIVATRILEALEITPIFRRDVYGDGHSAEAIANAVACWDWTTLNMKGPRPGSSVSVPS
jgi:UDP-GlcNAc3NAcA epimerase